MENQIFWLRYNACTVSVCMCMRQEFQGRDNQSVDVLTWYKLAFEMKFRTDGFSRVKSLEDLHFRCIFRLCIWHVQVRGKFSPLSANKTENWAFSRRLPHWWSQTSHLFRNQFLSYAKLSYSFVWEHQYGRRKNAVYRSSPFVLTKKQRITPRNKNKPNNSFSLSILLNFLYEIIA